MKEIYKNMSGYELRRWRRNNLKKALKEIKNTKSVNNYKMTLAEEKEACELLRIYLEKHGYYIRY